MPTGVLAAAVRRGSCTDATKTASLIQHCEVPSVADVSIMNACKSCINQHQHQLPPPRPERARQPPPPALASRERDQTGQTRSLPLPRPHHPCSCHSCHLLPEPAAPAGPALAAARAAPAASAAAGLAAPPAVVCPLAQRAAGTAGEALPPPAPPPAAICCQARQALVAAAAAAAAAAGWRPLLRLRQPVPRQHWVALPRQSQKPCLHPTNGSKRQQRQQVRFRPDGLSAAIKQVTGQCLAATKSNRGHPPTHSPTHPPLKSTSATAARSCPTLPLAPSAAGLPPASCRSAPAASARLRKLGHSRNSASSRCRTAGQCCCTGGAGQASSRPAASQAAHCTRALPADRHCCTACAAAANNCCCSPASDADATAAGCCCSAGSLACRENRLPSACRPLGRSLSLSPAAVTASRRHPGSMPAPAPASAPGTAAAAASLQIAALLSMWHKQAREAPA